MKTANSIIKNANSIVNAEFIHAMFANSIDLMQSEMLILDTDEKVNENLTEREKIAILAVSELSKALSNKSQTCMSDLNYAKVKTKTIDYKICSVVNHESDKRIAHIYLKVSKNALKADIVFSIEKRVREQILAQTAICEQYNIRFEKNNDYSVAKAVDFDNIVDTVKVIQTFLNCKYLDKASDKASEQ